MTFKLRILPRAERDIQCIFDFIAEQSADGARHWWNAFHEAACRAGDYPGRFPFAPENALSACELRQFSFKTRRGRSYRAIFAVVNDEVRLLRVRGPGQAPLCEDELTLG